MNQNLFKNICMMTQAELKAYLSKEMLQTYGENNVIEIEKENSFIYAQGTFPVLLIAHLDTVHKEPPKTFYWNKKTQSISSPQGIGGDDRCGVYMILEILKKYNCSVLFCEDEEIGGIGANNFVENISQIEVLLEQKLEFNYMIEFDRANSKDAVFYDCDNKEFEKFITKEFYKTSYGTFSDISTIAPALEIAAVNLSCGYYKAHTKNEYVVPSEMEKSINAAIKILQRTDIEKDKFKYIKSLYSEFYDYNNIWKGYKKTEFCYIFQYYDGNSILWDAEIASNKEEAIGKFLINHPNYCYKDILDIDVDYDFI